MLNYFTDHALDELKANIDSNIELYKDDSSFVKETFYLYPLWKEEIENININNLTLEDPDQNEEHETINTIKVHKALKALTPIQAADERLWSYLSHENFWKYMRKRWPIEDANNEVSRVSERYFFVTNANRALVRHGIARLWWYGYYAYDSSNKENPYWLVNTLVKNHSAAQDLLERSFSNNKNIVLAVLKLVKEMEGSEHDIQKRPVFRELIKHFNIKGGASVLDMLDSDDIKEILKEKYFSIIK